MGLGGISLWQLLIILIIVMMIFGTKKLRNMGSDLGGAVKGFRKAVSDAEREEPPKLEEHSEPAALESGAEKTRQPEDTQ